MILRSAAAVLVALVHAGAPVSPAAGSAAVSPAPAPAAEPVAEPVASEPTATTPIDPAAGPLAIDMVLPCGVRVIAAQDLSLPVAAVLLAIETGTEDDPPELPGLVHALTYHLLQGNREIAPGGIARIVHDGGGTTSLAIGPAQVRYESLVPVSLLDAVITAEANRLRAPTVSEALWKDTLRWARRDRGRSWTVPAAARAAVHQIKGIAGADAKRDAAISELSERAISSQLAERFGYDRATLVVVAPEQPQFVLNRVLAAFADLPAAPRRARDRTVAARTGSSPRTFEQRGSKGALLWPIAPDVGAQAWARTVCSALNHQKRSGDEPSRVRVRCSIDDDPRRGVLMLRPSGGDDPIAIVRGRLARLREADAALLADWQVDIAGQLAFELRTPLALARHLARVRAELPAGATPIRPLAELLGATALAEPLAPAPAAAPAALAPLLDLGAATQLVEPVHGGGESPP